MGSPACTQTALKVSFRSWGYTILLTGCTYRYDQNVLADLLWGAFSPLLFPSERVPYLFQGARTWLASRLITFIWEMF